MALCGQEGKFGPEKVALVKLLQQHGVVVKGGPEGGQQLLDALMVSEGWFTAQ